jgi:hypothetical protein
MKLFQCLFGLALSTAQPALAATASPVVVELFQSQGCSSCPPANAILNELSARPDILALNFSVTYWDRLGWPDSFAKPAFTQRQYAYAAAMKSSEVFTPQLLVNGQLSVVGSNRTAVDAAIIKAPRASNAPSLVIDTDKVTIGGGRTKGSAIVWLVRYDPREQRVAVRRGENGGKTLPHRNIVRELTKIGQWSGQATILTLPAQTNPALRTAVLLQAGPGGPILAARKS